MTALGAIMSSCLTYDGLNHELGKDLPFCSNNDMILMSTLKIFRKDF